ncbi:MAG: HEPN domain-containing protein [Anaerolineae bacterium]|nr:HEPN domain-containing protein [Anaerolineae bacterium]
MTFDWLDYRELASRLTRDPDTPGPQEAVWRTAISRAYYAALNYARAFAEEQDDDLAKGESSTHYAIRNWFKRKGRTGREIFNTLEEFQQLRQNADYDDLLPGPPDKLSEQALAYAQNVIDGVIDLRTRDTY